MCPMTAGVTEATTRAKLIREAIAQQKALKRVEKGEGMWDSGLADW